MEGKFILCRKLRFEVTDPEPQVFLKILTDANILLENIAFPDNLTVCFTALYQDADSISAVVNRRGANSKVLYRQGILWKFVSLLHRPVLLFGGFIFLILALLLPGRILRIEVVGNTCVPTRYILQCAEESQIRFGSAARKVRSEHVKNQILSAIPELQWVGINTRGCVATIHVEERSLSPQKYERNGVANIVAARDGIVSDLTVHSGSALCIPGQSVLEGEMLISGYADQGLKITATVARGEVYAYTRRELQAILPAATAIQGKARDKHTCYRLKIGKKVINFCNHSGISDATCDKMYLEYYWALPGGFRLPVSLIKETCCSYELQKVPVSETIPPWLEADSEAYLLAQMVAGEILDRNHNMEATAEYYCLRGVYSCREMIGKVRYEETLEKHAENN